MFARDPSQPRTPGAKFLLTVLMGALLAIPLFTVYLLVYDRQSQSTAAQMSITQGWGDEQVLAGPVLVIPYWETVAAAPNGKAPGAPVTVWHELIVAPESADLKTDLAPERRRRSIYNVVVYQAQTRGTARFVMPRDLDRLDVAADHLALDRAELRFGISDVRGLLGAPPQVSVGGRALALQPGEGPVDTEGAGFHAYLDARALIDRPIDAAFSYGVRGNASIALVPIGGDTRWRVASPWPSPSYQGAFLPVDHHETAKDFSATWRVGNLALGRTLVSVSDGDNRPGIERQVARVALFTPVDLYAQVNRAVKYGFLFIGFTFTALLMFDVIAGVRVTGVEYLLVGAGLILFFVMLLAFAEVIGFPLAYVVASGAIIGLLTAYSASVLRSRKRAGVIAGLLGALYAVLYVLISLEAYSLLIGSVLLFVALAAVMFLTRNVDWSGQGREAEAPVG